MILYEFVDYKKPIFSKKELPAFTNQFFLFQFTYVPEYTFLMNYVASTKLPRKVDY